MRLRIREIRLAKGMTLKELGDRIGRKPHSVWEYEHHKTRVPASILYAISQTLGVSMNDLCADDDPAAATVAPTNGHAVHARPPRRRGSRAPH